MLNQAVHRQHLVNLLLKLYGHTFLGSVLGFKGGTAAYFFYDLPRFSVDLDFDLLPAVAGKIEYGPQITRNITELVGQQYQIIDQSEKYNTLFWLVSYEKGSPRIKIEISTRKLANTYEAKPFYGVTLQVLQIGDAVAHKLVAIQDRKHLANRDLFDAHFFLSSPHVTKINYGLIEERTGLKPGEFYESLLQYLQEQKLGQKKQILDGLGEVLTQAQKDWVKAKLMDELIERVKAQKDTWLGSSAHTER